MEDIKNDLILEEKRNGIDEFNELAQTNPSEVVKALQNARAIDIAKNDKDVQAKIEENAKKVIDNTTKVIENESETELNASHFKLHKTASQMYGFKEERPIWQQKMMQVGSSVWFVIYFIIASLTVCPLSVFFDVFKNIFKKGWLSMVVALIVYGLVIFGIPIISSYIGKLGIIK